MLNDIEWVLGGCVEYCWGDFSLVGFGVFLFVGVISGFRGGLVVIGLGVFFGGLGYVGSIIGDKMFERMMNVGFFMLFFFY